MSTNREPTVIAKREQCVVCGNSQLEVAIELPNLPLTGIYSKEPMKDPVRGIDQQLLICSECGHGQLAQQVAPSSLYSDGYSFRTSASATARQGTGFFLSVLDEIASGKHFNCILDLGCNDLYLLKQLQGRASVRVGIDPMWASKEDQRVDKDITVIGAAIEDVDLDSALEAPSDLVVCRHTLEHIHEPRAVLRQLFAATAEDALFLFEVPGFEALVHRLRFDQVFHQHLQYFTLTSFQRLLLEEVGGVYIAHRENYHDWGALLVIFAKGNDSQGRGNEKALPAFDVPAIRERYTIFRQQLSTTNDVLKSLEGTTVYGYGAAQMLPVLAYHLDNDLSLLTAVLDDDPAKDGLYYWNLPLVIRHTPSVTGLEDASVFITAVDNVKPILSKLLMRRPRHIIYPFHII